VYCWGKKILFLLKNKKRGGISLRYDGVAPIYDWMFLVIRGNKKKQ
jgi:hypothetical protein